MNSVYEATVQLNEAIALVEILFFDKVTSNFFSRIEGYFTQQFSVSFGPKKRGGISEFLVQVRYPSNCDSFDVMESIRLFLESEGFTKLQYQRLVVGDILRGSNLSSLRLKPKT